MPTGFGTGNVVGEGWLRLGTTLDTSGAQKGLTGLSVMAGKTAAQIGKVFGVYAGAAGLVMAVKASTDAFVQFDKALKNSWTLVTETNAEMEKSGKAVREMARQYNTASIQSERALYQIWSATFYGADSMRILEESTRGAAAGLSDLMSTADMITTVLNAYGKSASEAAHINDLLFTAVRFGKVTYGELADQFGRLAGVSAPTGASVEDMAAAIATLTRQGIEADWAVTSLRQTLMQFIKPTKNLKAAIMDLGYAGGSAMIKQNGFAESLKMITKWAKVNNVEMDQMFTNVRAVTAVLPLATTAADGFAKDQQRMADSAGQASLAFEKQTQSISYQLEKFKTMFGDLAISVGKTFVPALMSMVGALELMAGPLRVTIDLFNQMGGGYAVAIATNVGLITIAILALHKAIIMLTAAFAKMVIGAGILGASLRGIIDLGAMVGATTWASGLLAGGGLLAAGVITLGAMVKVAIDFDFHLGNVTGVNGVLLALGESLGLVLGGAAAGMIVGALFGPGGAAVGGIVGAAAGATAAATITILHIIREENQADIDRLSVAREAIAKTQLPYSMTGEESFKLAQQISGLGLSAKETIAVMTIFRDEIYKLEDGVLVMRNVTEGAGKLMSAFVDVTGGLRLTAEQAETVSAEIMKAYTEMPERAGLPLSEKSIKEFAVSYISQLNDAFRATIDANEFGTILFGFSREIDAAVQQVQNSADRYGFSISKIAGISTDLLAAGNLPMEQHPIEAVKAVIDNLVKSFADAEVPPDVATGIVYKIMQSLGADFPDMFKDMFIGAFGKTEQSMSDWLIAIWENAQAAAAAAAAGPAVAGPSLSTDWADAQTEWSALNEILNDNTKTAAEMAQAYQDMGTKASFWETVSKAIAKSFPELSATIEAQVEKWKVWLGEDATNAITKAVQTLYDSYLVAKEAFEGSAEGTLEHAAAADALASVSKKLAGYQLLLGISAEDLTGEWKEMDTWLRATGITLGNTVSATDIFNGAIASISTILLSVASQISGAFATLQQSIMAAGTLGEEMSGLAGLLSGAGSIQAYRENLEKVITGTNFGDIFVEWAKNKLASLGGEPIPGKTYAQIAQEEEAEAAKALREAAEARKEAIDAFWEATLAPLEAAYTSGKFTEIPGLMDGLASSIVTLDAEYDDDASAMEQIISKKQAMYSFFNGLLSLGDAATFAVLGMSAEELKAAFEELEVVLDKTTSSLSAFQEFLAGIEYTTAEGAAQAVLDIVAEAQAGSLSLQDIMAGGQSISGIQSLLESARTYAYRMELDASLIEAALAEVAAKLGQTPEEIEQDMEEARQKAAKAREENINAFWETIFAPLEGAYKGGKFTEIPGLMEGLASHIVMLDAIYADDASAMDQIISKKQEMYSFFNSLLSLGDTATLAVLGMTAEELGISFEALKVILDNVKTDLLQDGLDNLTIAMSAEGIYDGLKLLANEYPKSIVEIVAHGKKLVDDMNNQAASLRALAGENQIMISQAIALEGQASALAAALGGAAAAAQSFAARVAAMQWDQADKSFDEFEQMIEDFSSGAFTTIELAQEPGHIVTQYTETQRKTTIAELTQMASEIESYSGALSGALQTAWKTFGPSVADIESGKWDIGAIPAWVSSMQTLLDRAKTSMEGLNPEEVAAEQDRIQKEAEAAAKAAASAAKTAAQEAIQAAKDAAAAAQKAFKDQFTKPILEGFDTGDWKAATATIVQFAKSRDSIVEFAKNLSTANDVVISEIDVIGLILGAQSQLLSAMDDQIKLMQLAGENTLPLEAMKQSIEDLLDPLGGFKKLLREILGIQTPKVAAQNIRDLAELIRGPGGTGFQSGGIVSGVGDQDSVPAMLTPGEFVIPKWMMRIPGVASLISNIWGHKFADGGCVGGTCSLGGMQSFDMASTVSPGVAAAVAGTSTTAKLNERMFKELGIATEGAVKAVSGLASSCQTCGKAAATQAATTKQVAVDVASSFQEMLGPVDVASLTLADYGKQILEAQAVLKSGTATTYEQIAAQEKLDDLFSKVTDTANGLVSQIENEIDAYKIFGWNIEGLTQQLAEAQAALANMTVQQMVWAKRWEDMTVQITSLVTDKLKTAFHSLLKNLFGLSDAAKSASLNIPSGYKVTRAEWGAATPGEPGALTDDAGNANNFWESLLTILGDSLIDWTISDIVDKLVGWVITDIVSPVIEWFVDDIVKPITDWFVTDVLKPIWDWVITDIVQPLLFAIIDIVEPIVSWLITDVIKPIASWLITDIIKPLIAGVNWVITDVIAPITDWGVEHIVKPLIAGVDWYIRDIVTPITDWVVQNIVEPLKAGISWFITDIVSPITNSMWGSVLGKVDWDKYLSGITEATLVAGTVYLGIGAGRSIGAWLSDILGVNKEMRGFLEFIGGVFGGGIMGALMGFLLGGHVGAWIGLAAGSIAGAIIGAIPEHATGGTVAGAIGSPQIILAHGGEEIIPLGQSSFSGVSGGGMVIDNTIMLDSNVLYSGMKKVNQKNNRRQSGTGYGGRSWR